MIEHLLNQNCEIVKVERDSYGKVVQSEPIATKCRATESFQMVKNNAGEEVVSSIQFWLPKEVDIVLNTITKRKIKFDGKDYTIISVRNRRDTYGESVFKVVSA